MNQPLLDELKRIESKTNSFLNKEFNLFLEPKKLYDASRHLIFAGGKRLRPFLTIKSCGMVGGNEDDSIPIAVALELIHTFSLIHDDIMDEDDIRRGVPTVHNLWGMPLAIISGDLIFTKAFDIVLNSKKLYLRKKTKILKIITKVMIDICEGQALDTLFEKKESINEEEYFEMIRKKTSSLIEASSKCGVIIGGGNETQINFIGNFAKYLGITFQIIDDVLGLIGEKEVTGKPVGSDLIDGKKTLPIIHALNNASNEERDKILYVLGNKKSTNKNIMAVVGTIKKLGSIDYAILKASFYTKKTKDELSEFENSKQKEILLNLCDYLLSRKF